MTMTPIHVVARVEVEDAMTVVSAPDDRPNPERDCRLFARGYLAMLPLWTGAIPVGLAYGVAARGAGFGVVETQMMSLLVFSAAAQMSAVALLAAGASWLMIIATALLLHAQLPLLGLSVARGCRPGRLGRLAGAFLLTDGAYAVALSTGRLTVPGLCGAGASMYIAWNIGTALGSVAGQGIADPRRFGIDLVAPLMFLAVLLPLLRGRPTIVAALAAGATTLALAASLPGVAVPAGCLAGTVAGARWAGARAR